VGVRKTGCRSLEIERASMSKEKASTSEQRLAELQEGTLAAPKDSELCLTLGEAFLRVNRVDEAAASYQRAVELDPRSDLRALYWEWLGLVREMEGRLEEALEAYFQWLDTDPVAISPLDRLGTLLVVLGRWTDLGLLGPQFERRIEVSGHPRGKESLALYTFVTEQFGQSQEEKEKAKEVTLSALEADPDSPSMRFLLGLLTYREGSFELARGEFERVLELDSEGLWHEPRFALDWNGWKARVMVAKLSRQQGDVETALQLLTEADDLDSSDSEGLIEVAELLVENHRYDDMLKLVKLVDPGPSRLSRLEAESLLGKGRLNEALTIIETEASLFTEDDGDVDVAEDSAFLSRQLGQLWELYQQGESIAEQLAEMRREASEALLANPLGACLVLLHRQYDGALGVSGVEQEIQQLCRLHSTRVEVWDTAARLYSENGQVDSSRLAALVASKLRHGAHAGPTGAFTMTGLNGARVLVGVVTEFGPLVVKLEADVSRKTTDQLFGWGREFLMPGLELAKGVLENLAEAGVPRRSTCSELSFFPRSFRVMITPVSVPTDSSGDRLLTDGELGSLPLGFLVAMLSVMRKPPIPEILVMGRLGLRGQIDGVPDLEETLLAVHQSGVTWKQLLLAEAGGFRLLRAPAWLWHGRSVTLVKSASELAFGQVCRKVGESQRV
jgi:tetratricopeptide (TPR) repeat protein